jgi:hypothetical protein
MYYYYYHKSLSFSASSLDDSDGHTGPGQPQGNPENRGLAGPAEPEPTRAATSGNVGQLSAIRCDGHSLVGRQENNEKEKASHRKRTLSDTESKIARHAALFSQELTDGRPFWLCNKAAESGRLTRPTKRPG